MKKALFTAAALAAFSFGQVIAMDEPPPPPGDGTDPAPMATTTMVDTTAEHSTTMEPAPMPSLWLTPDVPPGLMNIPMLAVVINDAGMDIPICLKDVKLMWDFNAPGIQFNLVDISPEDVPMDKCPMPAMPMMPMQ